MPSVSCGSKFSLEDSELPPRRFASAVQSSLSDDSSFGPTGSHNIVDTRRRRSVFVVYHKQPERGHNRDSTRWTSKYCFHVQDRLESYFPLASYMRSDTLRSSFHFSSRIHANEGFICLSSKHYWNLSLFMQFLLDPPGVSLVHYQ